MPNKVKQKNISFDTVSVLNATRNGASPYYQNSVPVAVPQDIERLRMIGDIITGDEIIKMNFCHHCGIELVRHILKIRYIITHGRL